MSATSTPRPKPRPKARTLPQSGKNATRSEARARSSSNNVTRSEPRPRSTSASIASLAQKNDILKTENELLKEELKTCLGLKAENDELKSLLEVKNSMKGLNKMVSLVEFEELKKRDEIRTRMLTEDLRAFQEKRQEIILDRIKRRNDEHSWRHFRERQRGVEEDKFHYISVVIDHLKLLNGISPIDLCYEKYADNALEDAERERAFFGRTQHPYKVQYKTDNFFTDVTREELIDSIKKGLTTRIPVAVEHEMGFDTMKQNLLDKTIDWIGRYHG
jgi:hypothetical protein